MLSPSVRLPCDLSAIWQRAGCFPEIHSTVDWILSQHLCFEHIIQTDKVIPGNDGPWKTDKGVTCSSYGAKWGHLPLIYYSTPSRWWRIFILIPNTHTAVTHLRWKETKNRSDTSLNHLLDGTVSQSFLQTFSSLLLDAQASFPFICPLVFTLY